MGFNIVTTDEKGCKVYCNEKEWNGVIIKNYSTVISAKDQSGNWTKAYLNIGFKRGAEPNNKSVINIKNSFLTTKKWSRGYVPFLMVIEYELLEDGEKFQPNDDFMKIPEGFNDDIPFQ